MNIQTQEYYHGVVVAIRGKYLGSRGGDVFLDTLYELRESGKRRVVVDLSRTEMMDSTALGTLLEGRAMMRATGGDLRLAGMEKRVRSLFLMTHLLGPVFEAYPTIDAALTSYQMEFLAEVV